MSSFLILSLKSMCKFLSRAKYLKGTGGLINFQIASWVIMPLKNRPILPPRLFSRMSMASSPPPSRTDHSFQRALFRWVVFRTGAKVLSANGARSLSMLPVSSLSMWRSRLFDLRTERKGICCFVYDGIAQDFLHLLLSFCFLIFFSSLFIFF